MKQLIIITMLQNRSETAHQPGKILYCGSLRQLMHKEKEPLDYKMCALSFASSCIVLARSISERGRMGSARCAQC